jgi:RNA recognition motif-containing protein
MRRQTLGASATSDTSPVVSGETIWKNANPLNAPVDPSGQLSYRTDDITVFSGLSLQPGESMDPYERSLSAPPPPGFGHGPEERARKMNGLLHGVGDARNNSRADCSNSFTNLAAFFGTGLAQSMEDATREQLPDSAFSNEDLNFHRQTRHAASRLLGTTTDPLALPKTASNDSAFSASHGFPTCLSSPSKKTREVQRKEEERADVRGSTTPVQMVAGQARQGGPDRLRNERGTMVVEPEGESQLSKVASAVSSQRIDVPLRTDRGVAELERGLKNMLSSDAREFRPTPTLDGAVSNASSMSAESRENSEITSRQAEMELRPFIWDTHTNESSRTLLILYVAYLRVPDVRAACETFGVLESFRGDFASRGIYFVSYYDIRSAHYASLDLQPILQRLSVMQGSSEEVVTRFCIPLNSSSQFDESQILISEVPGDINENVLRSMLSSYGSIRSVVPENIGAFQVEFHSIQDAKQAQLELESSQPFGPHAFVEVGMRNSVDRKRGRELLATISRWRQGLNRRLGSHHISTDPRLYAGGAQATTDPWRGITHSSSSLMPAHNEGIGMGAVYSRSGDHTHHQRQTTQLILGPDGRYTPIVVQNHTFPPPGSGPHHQQLSQGPNGQMYLTSVAPSQQHMFVQQQGPASQSRGGFPTTIVTNIPSTEARVPQTRTPYYMHVVTDASSASGRSHRSSAYSTGTDGLEKDARHLLLDLDTVDIGDDTRTSVMVRNIPNKYTQQMLLSEFEEHGHGPGVIDFFYLPIDFKNRCNRGYAFINFVDYRDILTFHKRYYGTHWRTFNSDKICDITYARIQGKAAMLKRFENSALMEKDDEYKPLVFMSNGPDKGKRLPFPDLSGKTAH